MLQPICVSTTVRFKWCCSRSTAIVSREWEYSSIALSLSLCSMNKRISTSTSIRNGMSNEKNDWNCMLLFILMYVMCCVLVLIQCSIGLVRELDHVQIPFSNSPISCLVIARKCGFVSLIFSPLRVRCSIFTCIERKLI